MLHVLRVKFMCVCCIWLWGGFGFGVKFGLLSTTISWLAGNAAVVSGLSAVILTSGFRDIRSSGTQTFLTDSRHGNLNFRWVIYFRFRSGFCFRSDFYIRDSDGTTASPCAWPEDHGRGRFYASIRVSDQFPGPPAEKPTRMAAWQVAATYITWRCGFHILCQNTLVTRLKIDAND